jgi:cold shock CspA family protein
VRSHGRIAYYFLGKLAIIQILLKLIPNLKRTKGSARYLFFHSRRMNGIIKKLVADKGFGFIAPENGGDDLFFHCTKVEGGGQIFNSWAEIDPSTNKPAKEGAAVEYTPVQGKKGLEAHDVKLAA